MQKINITIEVNKISKNKISERRYFDKENHEVVVKELKLEVVPLKESKILKEGDTWTLVKTHFVAEERTKQEAEAQMKSRIIGTGTMFISKEKVENTENQVTEDVDSSSIPF